MPPRRLRATVSGVVLALVAASAGLHVAWNGAVRGAGGSPRFIWLLTLGAALGGLVVTGPGLLAPALWRAWPELALTVPLNAAYFVALGRAYVEGELSWAYPLARGLAIALTAPLALVALGQPLGPLAWVGVGVVAAGLVALGPAPVAGPPGRVREGAARAASHRAPASGPPVSAPARPGPAEGPGHGSEDGAGLGLAEGSGGGAAPSRPGGGRGPGAWRRWLWPVAVGVLVAAYSLVDSQAVRRGAPPLAYACLEYLGCALLLWPGARRQARLPRPGIPLGAGAVSLASYVLLLHAYRLAPVGGVLALRQIAPSLATLVGALALRERVDGRRALATAAIVVGAVLIALP